MNVDDGRHRVDLRARFFREVQVVAVKGVLGVVRASIYAAPTEDAASAVWSDATEVRVGNRLAGLAEERAHLGRVKRVGDIQIVCNRLEHLVCSGQPRIGRDAEHSFGRVVIRR
ncbi:hypothetical protein [Mycobacterium sp.]|uniref:hypothetical protein n=1 Tax=Mycobacterium sp. TaxID=1785 RepID=UPI003C71BA16